MNKDTEKENKSRSLEIQTKNLFGEYLADDTINEICCNGDGSIWTQDYKSVWTEHKRDLKYEQMMAFAVPVASHKEDTLKSSKPILSASLNNGERIQIVIPPAVKKNKVSITIRKPSKKLYTFDDFKAQGYLDRKSVV